MHAIFRPSLVAVLAATASVALAAQGQAPTAKRTTTTAKYLPPRTVDGQPKLQGVWANNAGTPVERPKIIADKALLTDEELRSVEKHAAKLFTGGCDAAFADQVFTAALSNTT